MKKYALLLTALLLAICTLLTSCNTSDEVTVKKKKKKKRKNTTTSSVESTGSDNSADADSDNSSYYVSDTGESFYIDDDTTSSNNGSTTTKTEKPEKPETRDMSNIIDPRTGGADAEAAKKRNEILNTGDNLKITGTTYYISPSGDNYAAGTSPKTAWKTLDALTLYSYKLKAGDGVLFERGGVYRQSSSINAKSGVTYGAYGSGPKPAIYGSVKNYAQPGLWTASKKKFVWKLKLPLEDTGLLVINHGEICQGKKSGLLSLTKNGDFYHNVTDGILYMYCDKGYPDVVYDDIEIGTKRSMFIFGGYVHDVVVDNLCFKYVGGHGISGYGNNSNITITNCEIGWIGGSEMRAGVRYGNGVQFWDSCSDVVVKNCWVYQVYDAGLTFQGGAGSEYKNIDFSDNLLQFCNYSIEFFIQEVKGKIDNVLFSNNIMQYAGCGFTMLRPSRNDASHICGWTYDYPAGTVNNFVIKDNVFDCSDRNLINWTFTNKNDITATGNTFYQKANYYKFAVNYGSAGQLNATGQSEFESAVAAFDSSPKLIKWLDK